MRSGRSKSVVVAVASLLLLLTLECVSKESLTAEQIRFFENRIRPQLVAHCYECHSSKEGKVEGKLDVATKTGLQQGGETGAVVVPGDAERSLLIQTLHYDGTEMPPEKPLPEDVIADFVKWVEMGAPDPRKDGQIKDAHIATNPIDGDPAYWSFHPIKNPSLPQVSGTDWPEDSLDFFVLERLEDEGVDPVQAASPSVLLRRLHVDLLGLPPAMDEIKAFEREVAVEGRRAIVRKVDELLASPHFGERWGRHWLDVARYAESNGNDGLSRNPTFPHAWRYRDYVIDSFNRDVPYNRFLLEQIAGDHLKAASEEERDKNLIATGLLALGAKPAKAMNNDFAMDVVADQIDVIGRGVMGVSVACARCHDHKFDPVPTRDYYALAGIFQSTETMWGLAANEKLTAPPTDLHVLKTARHYRAPEGFKETVILKESATGKPKAIPKPKWKAGTPLAMGVRDVKKPVDAKININGDSKKLGDSVPRGFLTAYPSLKSSAVEKIGVKSSGRLELAQWLVHPDHPQTARVMVNRIWAHLFGEGIVRTPDDFGVYGDRPSHPELLDHLATRFVNEGWSIKGMIRSIVLSRTYQLGSDASPDLVRKDPENRLLARHSRRRLDAESLRDHVLKVTGELEPTWGRGSLIGHRDILVNLAGSLHEPSRQRSVYLCYLRNAMPPELTAFDLPDFKSVSSQRETSTVPGQALFLFNNPFIVEQAGLFARRLIESNQSPEERIRKAYNEIMLREPSADEVNDSLRLLKEMSASEESDFLVWQSLCQALLVTNEFRYVD